MQRADRDAASLVDVQQAGTRRGLRGIQQGVVDAGHLDFGGSGAREHGMEWELRFSDERPRIALLTGDGATLDIGTAALVVDYAGDSPLADLGKRTVDEQVLRSLSEEIARQRQVILFAREEDGSVDAAMLDPSDLETIEFLSQHLKTRINPFLATQDDLNRGFSIYGFRSTGDFKRIIEENVQASLRSQTKTVEEAAAELPVFPVRAP